MEGKGGSTLELRYPGGEGPPGYRQGWRYHEAVDREMRLEEAKTTYPGEWIAFRPFEESDNPEGEVVLHRRDRRAFDRELVDHGFIDVYITFAGPPVPEGYAAMF